MKKQKQKQKLTVRTETLRALTSVTLTEDQLRHVGGGIYYTKPAGKDVAYYGCP